MPRPARSASPPIAASWSVAPSCASMSSATTSASAIASFASATLTISTFPPREIRPGRRMPAVSTMRKWRRCHSSGASIASRVVPGMSLTSTRSSRSSRLTSDDFPTFGPADDGDARLPIGGRGGALGLAPSLDPSAGSPRAIPWPPAAEPLGPQPLHDLIEQLAHPGPVLGGNLEHRLEAELVELHRRLQRALVVGLVDGEQHGKAGLAQLARDPLVAGDQPFASIHEQHQQIGVDDGALPLLRRPARAADPRSRRTTRLYRTAGTRRLARSPAWPAHRASFRRSARRSRGGSR